MAGQTINASLSRTMAIDALSHGPIDFTPHLREFCDVAVTVTALNACFDMPLMREIDRRFNREKINGCPGNLLIASCIGCQLFDFRTIGLDRLVTNHTLSNTGNSCHTRSLGAVVAKDALHLICNMNLMGKSNGLPNHGRFSESLHCYNHGRENQESGEQVFERCFQ